ncbi:MAG TPA: hypothetical protein VIH57_00900, partial [Bacteroidales bacterium]
FDLVQFSSEDYIKSLDLVQFSSEDCIKSLDLVQSSSEDYIKSFFGEYLGLDVDNQIFKG